MRHVQVLTWSKTWLLAVQDNLSMLRASTISITVCCSPGYETLLEDNIGNMQVGAARSGLVRSLHQNDQLFFQKSLPSSLSDSSLMMVGPESVMEKPARKMVPVSPRALLSMSLDEDVSSPESTDSAGPQEDKPNKKRLIRRTLLPKLLKNRSLVDKQKVC